MAASIRKASRMRLMPREPFCQIAANAARPTRIESPAQASAPKKVAKAEFFKIDDEERVVGGIVYAPDEVDGQGDYTDAREIWKAMKRYMVENHGVMKIMHEGLTVGTPIVECFQAEQDTTKEGVDIPAGAWYLCVHVPAQHELLWKAIKAGDIGGFSMAGEAEGELEED